MVTNRRLALFFLLILVATTPVFPQECDPPKCGAKTKKTKITWNPQTYTWTRTSGGPAGTFTKTVGASPDQLDTVVTNAINTIINNESKVTVVRRPNQCLPTNTCFCQLSAPQFFKNAGTRAVGASFSFPTGPGGGPPFAGTWSATLRVENQTAIEDGVCERATQEFVPDEWRPPAFPQFE